MAATPADKGFTQARIRVNEEGAFETSAALELLEEHYLGLRKLAMDEGFTELIPVLNRKLGTVRRVIEEASRTITEAGW